jgi:hypothetical protein
VIQHDFGWASIVLHSMTSMFSKFLAHDWKSCGDSRENILYQFIKDQTHFGMPRVAKMSLALFGPQCTGIDSSLYSKHAPQVKRYL